MRPKVPLSLQKAYAEHFPSSIIKRSQVLSQCPELRASFCPRHRLTDTCFREPLTHVCACLPFDRTATSCSPPPSAFIRTHHPASQPRIVTLAASTMAGTAKPRKASHDNGSWGLYLIWALSAASLWCCWQSEYVLTFGYRSVPILFNMTLPFVSVACYVVVIFSLPTIVNRCGSYRGVRTHVEANFPHSAKRGQKVVIELNNGSELEFKVLSNWQPGVATEKPVKDASKPKTQDPNAVVAVRSVKSCEVEGGMSPSAFTVIVDKAPLINPEVFRIVDAMWNFLLCWLSVVMLFGVLISVGLRMHENGTFNPWTFFCDEAGWAHDQPENRPSASAEEL